MCYTKNCVYKITCQSCKESYIGSTIRTLHCRIKEHLTSDRSSVYSHRQQCRANFEYKIIAREKDNIKLRFKEAMLIAKQSPNINSRAEREELRHLIF